MTVRIRADAKRGPWDGQKSDSPIQNLIFLVAPKVPQLPGTRVTDSRAPTPTPLAWSIFREGPHLPQINIDIFICLIFPFFLCFQSSLFSLFPYLYR